MNYRFLSDIERQIKDYMADGEYASVDDVLRDALRALDEIACFQPGPPATRITSVEQLRREVTLGIEQLDRGEGRDAEAVFDDLLRDLPSPD